MTHSPHGSLEGDLSPGPRTTCADLDAALRESLPRPLAELVDDWLLGTPDSVERRMREYRQMDVSHFMLWFLAFPSLNGMRLFAERVAPTLRGDR